MKKTVLMHCTILDGSEQMEPQENMTVTLEGGKIAAIEPDGELPEDVNLFDLQGHFLMPGMINLHAHLAGDGKPGRHSAAKKLRWMTGNPISRSALRVRCSSNTQTEMMSGVTTIRTAGGIGKGDTLVRDWINIAHVEGPRVLASNMAVSTLGGHMAGTMAYAATSEEEARAIVHKISEDKPDWIKLVLTGSTMDAKGQEEYGGLRMPPEYVRACCEEAHALGLRVMAHANSAESMRAALEGGVDTIEHGARMDEELAEVFRNSKAALVCTLSSAVPHALLEPKVSMASDVQRHNAKAALEGMVACAKTALENGIPVGLGSDAGNPFVTHYDMWRELYWFAKFVGVSNAFALYTATRRNAEIAGIGDVTGSIETGKWGDFFVTDRNPLEDLTALREPTMVVNRGIIFSPKVIRIKQVDSALDRLL